MPTRRAHANRDLIRNDTLWGWGKTRHKTRKQCAQRDVHILTRRDTHTKQIYRSPVTAWRRRQRRAYNKGVNLCVLINCKVLHTYVHIRTERHRPRRRRMRMKCAGHTLFFTNYIEHAKPHHPASGPTTCVYALCVSSYEF